MRIWRAPSRSGTRNQKDIRISITTKLILSFLLIIVMTSAIFTAVGIGLINSHIEDDAQEHYYNSYYDEMDLDLGFPTGPMRQIESTGERGRGTYVRFFGNGAVILNVNEYSRTVTDAQIRGMNGYDGGDVYGMPLASNSTENQNPQ